jgi:ATP-dependent helicase HrpA
MKAIVHRLDRLQGNLLRDEQATQEINALMARWRSCSNPLVESAQHYRWMLEEYRISLFAQSVGTSIPVSSKRLEKQWQKVLQEQ